MDKLVNRVTVVQGSGPTREAKTVYDGRDEDLPTIPIDSIVARVTVVEGSGAGRHAKIVHRSQHWEDRDTTWQDVEHGMRRFLKADMIRAQEAYRRHKESAHDEKQLWWLDLPANMIRAFIKAGEMSGKDKRSEGRDLDADARHVGADMRELKDALEATAADVKSEFKNKASDTKTKVKGA